MSASRHTSLALLLAFSAACGGDANQTADERAEQMEDYAARHGVDVDVEGDGDDQQIIVNQGVPGTTARAGKNLDLPEDFPDDVPTYPGWSIHSTAAMGPGTTLGAMVPDDVETVASFYREQLANEGWTEQGGNELPTMRILRFSKGNRVLGVTIAEGEDESTLQLTIATIPGN